MNSVVEFPAKLRRHDFCRCDDPSFSRTWQAWSTRDVDDAVRDADFLQPMAPLGIEAGDTVELFEVRHEHLDKPETDPVAMASLWVRSIDVDQKGKHVRFERAAETLRFNGSASKGVHAGEWNNQYWVYWDGHRRKSFRTKLEMGEYAHSLKLGKGTI